MIGRTPTIRLPNSIVPWRLFSGKKLRCSHPGHASQPSPDAVSRTAAPVATIRKSDATESDASRKNRAGATSSERRRPSAVDCTFTPRV